MGKDCRRNIDLQWLYHKYYDSADCHFLFTEAFGLFGNKVTEEGYVLAVNGKNPVRELSAVQIKDVFDEEITNWSEVGGPDIGIKVFRLEDITSYFRKKSWGRNTTRRENVSVR